MASLSALNSPTLQAKTCVRCPHPSGEICPVAKRNGKRKAGDEHQQVASSSASPKEVVDMNSTRGQQFLDDMGLTTEFQEFLDHGLRDSLEVPMLTIDPNKLHEKNDGIIEPQILQVQSNDMMNVPIQPLVEVGLKKNALGHKEHMEKFASQAHYNANRHDFDMMKLPYKYGELFKKLPEDIEALKRISGDIDQGIIQCQNQVQPWNDYKKKIEDKRTDYEKEARFYREANEVSVADIYDTVVKTADEAIKDTKRALKVTNKVLVFLASCKKELAEKISPTEQAQDKNVPPRKKVRVIAPTDTDASRS